MYQISRYSLTPYPSQYTGHSDMLAGGGGYPGPAFPGYHHQSYPALPSSTLYSGEYPYYGGTPAAAPSTAYHTPLQVSHGGFRNIVSF